MKIVKALKNTIRRIIIGLTVALNLSPDALAASVRIPEEMTLFPTRRSVIAIPMNPATIPTGMPIAPRSAPSK